MPLVSNELDNQFWEPKSRGPAAQVDLSASALVKPTGTIAASGNFTSGVLNGNGLRNITVGLTSSQGGAASVQRYLDAAGTIPQGAAVTQTLTANTPAVLNVNDGLIYRTFVFEITNTSGSAATVSSFAFLMSP
jgi:hypothetical protein